MIHADPEYDMGITGVMKIAHFCEALGLDLQLHAVGPAHRLCISAMRNTLMYELALVGPDLLGIFFQLLFELLTSTNCTTDDRQFAFVFNIMKSLLITG